jgi:1-deoxy-D-xylulose-5-phosphate reductoisomerase
MMNKGLELLEASHLFGAAQKQLSAVIHPQSLVHGFVEYLDGSVIAHLASADMKLPLGFALGLETRIETGTKPLRLTEIAQLDFIEIDRDKFPCFAFAEQVIDEGPEKAIILNAANEIAVEAFLHDQIAFHQIATIVGKALDDKSDGDASSLEGVFDLDKKARLLALSYCQTL